MNGLASLCLEADYRADMIRLEFEVILDRIVTGPHKLIVERLVELDHEPVPEVAWHTAAVAGSISHDLVFLRNHLHIRTSVECIDHDIRIIGLRESETEISAPLRRSNLRSHVMISQIHAVVIRCDSLGLMREP